MFTPKNSPVAIALTDTRTPPLPELEVLNKKIESELLGRFVPPGFEDDILEDFERRGLDALRIKLHEIKTSLTAIGYDVAVHFCSSKLLDHPVPVLHVRDSEGRYGVPSFNLWWDPTIPRDFDAGDGGGSNEPKKVITVDDTDGLDRTAWGGDLVSTRLHVELFSSGVPVAILVLPSDSPNTPIAVKPIFSPTALKEALRHGAQSVLTGDQSQYSHVFHEVILPAVGAQIRQESPLFGERETPTITEGAVSDGGSTVSFTALYEGDQQSMRIVGRIIEDGLSLQARLTTP